MFIRRVESANRQNESPVFRTRISYGGRQKQYCAQNHLRRNKADLDAPDLAGCGAPHSSLNPDGTLHRYARVGGEMIPLELTRNPDCVAEADPLETLAARQLKH